MSTLRHLVAASTVLLLLAVPALAHHSAAAYNTQQQVTVKGTIETYQFKNPHIYMTLKVRKDDGTSTLMEVEAGAASVLNTIGFTKDSVKAGDLVTVTGNPSRNNADKFMLGKDLYKSDGAYFPLNIASRSVYTGKDAVAKSIDGTWFSPRTEFNAFLGGARNWAVTEKGRASMS